MYIYIFIYHIYTYVCIYVYIYLGSSINGGSPTWFIMEHPIKMGENWGYPMGQVGQVRPIAAASWRCSHALKLEILAMTYDM